MNEIFEDDLIDFLDEKYEEPAESHITFLFQNEKSSYNFDEEIESIIHNQEPSFAMKLSYDETMDLLKRAGLTLSHSNKKDLIVEYFLCHKIYDIFLLSEKIEKYGE